MDGLDDEEEDEEEGIEPLVPAPAEQDPLFATMDLDASQLDFDLDLDPSLHLSDLKAGYVQLALEERIGKRLRENVGLLDELQAWQWERLRVLYGGGGGGANAGVEEKGEVDVDASEPGKRERAVGECAMLPCFAVHALCCFTNSRLVHAP